MYFQPVNDEQYIKRCFELAERGKGSVSPNPLVGAVLVHNGLVIGEGWHERYGESHAEVNCLSSVANEHKHLISESTMYVSLEPCAHHGNTPPCANRLVEEKLKRVVIANKDPFEQVNGNGLQILNEAGTEVQESVLEQEGKWLNRRFFCYNELKRPYIILKWAETQDGFIAPEDRSRFQITNKASQQLLHKWRAEEDAIMVGNNTAKNDNPELTTRLWQGENPLRIVIDKSLELPANASLLNSSADTWVLNTKRNEQEGNINYVQLDFSENIIPQLLNKLYEAKVQSLIVEGGAVLLNSFIEAGLWDEARVFVGNKTLGNGIAAPRLNITATQEQAIKDDVLKLVVNPESNYPFVKGCEL